MTETVGPHNYWTTTRSSLQCETVGEDGLARLASPAAVGVGTAGRYGTAVLQAWKARFADAFDAQFP